MTVYICRKPRIPASCNISCTARFRYASVQIISDPHLSSISKNPLVNHTKEGTMSIRATADTNTISTLTGNRIRSAASVSFSAQVPVRKEKVPKCSSVCFIFILVRAISHHSTMKKPNNISSRQINVTGMDLYNIPLYIWVYPPIEKSICFCLTSG